MTEHLPTPADRPRRPTIDAVATELSTGAVVLYHPEREHHWGEWIHATEHVPLTEAR